LIKKKVYFYYFLVLVERGVREVARFRQYREKSVIDTNLGYQGGQYLYQMVPFDEVSSYQVFFLFFFFIFEVSEKKDLS